MKNFFVQACFLSLISFHAHAEKFYLLSNHTNVGDHNQVLGILTAFEKLSHKSIQYKDLDTKALTALEIKDQLEQDLSHEKVIVIGAGEGGIDGLAAITKHPNLVIALTSHQFLDPYTDKNLLKKVDYIALPTHVSSNLKEALGAKLIETTGVAHNRHADMKIYDQWKKDLPPADIYLGVYLGGDAPDQKKEIRFFTEKDSSRLADYVLQKGQELQNAGFKPCILVLNGPRTGKHDAEGKEILTVHREGKSDRITKLFANKLTNRGIAYKVFDFQHNTPENKEWVSPYNAFDLVVGAVRATKGTLFVPGESTSVISEAIDVLSDESVDSTPHYQAIVYHNNAMNDVHKAHVESELKAGRVSVLDNYEETRIPESTDLEPKPSASMIIAKKLLEVTSEKALNRAPEPKNIAHKNEEKH